MATGAPASANTPAAPATTTSESHEAETTCRAERSGVRLAAGERDRRDERDRGRRDRHEQRGDQVGVGERRRLARAEPAREAVGDRCRAPGSRTAARRPRRAAAAALRRRRRAARRRAGARGRASGMPSGERAVHREAPAERLHAVVDQRRRSRRDRRPRRRRSRARPCRSRRARRGRSPRCRRRPAPPRPGRATGSSWAALACACGLPVSSPATAVRERRSRRRAQRHERDGERERPGADLAAEPAGLLRPGELGQHDDAQRARDEHDRDVDEVGGEEPVRLDAVAELARENRARRAPPSR